VQDAFKENPDDPNNYSRFLNRELFDSLIMDLCVGKQSCSVSFTESNDIEDILKSPDRLPFLLFAQVACTASEEQLVHKTNVGLGIVIIGFFIVVSSVTFIIWLK